MTDRNETVLPSSDEPMSVFVRRAERYAADYTDLGSGYEREKRLDFFLRGALWMRSATEQALGPDPAAFESEVAGILMDEGCGNGDECDAIAAKISAALEAMRVKSSGR